MGCFSSKPTRQTRQIVVFGLDRSGKSSTVVSLLRKCAWMQSSSAEATDTQSVRPEDVEIYCAPPVTARTEALNAVIDGTNVSIVDTVGSAKGREQWPSLLGQASAVLFVVDCSDTLRLPLAAHELKKLAEQLPGRNRIPILVIANKFDKNCASIRDICDMLGGVPLCPQELPLPPLSLKPVNASDMQDVYDAAKLILHAGDAAPGPLYVSPEYYESIPKDLQQGT